MRLQIARAVVGSPEPGDELSVLLEDGTELMLEFKPHGSFERFVWMLKGECSHLQEALDGLEARGIESEWVTCYADDDWEVVVGQKLHLVLVPRGNMHDWPRFTTDTKVEDISIA